MRNEHWKTIYDVSDYEISDQGRVRSLKYGKLVYRKAHSDAKGYRRITLCMNGKMTTRKIHKLVAIAFIGLCPERYEINHKNGIKSDNRMSNLEYVTHVENMRHAFQAGLTKAFGEKGVCQLTRDSRLVAKYISATAAAAKTKINRSHISACCRGEKRRRSAGGYVWRFAV